MHPQVLPRPSATAERRIHWLVPVMLVGVPAAVVALVYLPPLAIGSRGLSRAEHLSAINDLRQSLMQLLGGLALGIGLIFTARTFVLSRAAQRVDQLAKAMEHVGSDSETVRAGGLYTLWLLTTSSVYWPIVEELLAAFIREHARPGSSPIGADVQAAVTLLGRRPDRPSGQKGLPLELRNLDLSGISFAGGNFRRIIFDNTYLEDSNLTDAKFDRSSVRNGRFTRANLSSVTLTRGELAGASFRDAELYGAKFVGADVSDCDFTNVLNFTSQGLADTRGSPAVSPP